MIYKSLSIILLSWLNCWNYYEPSVWVSTYQINYWSHYSH
jgi:hypothetical protein